MFSSHGAGGGTPRCTGAPTGIGQRRVLDGPAVCRYTMVNARRRVGLGDRRRGGRDGGVARPHAAATRSTASSTLSWPPRSTMVASPTWGEPRRWGGGSCSGRGAAGPKRPRSPLPTPGWQSTTASRPPRRQRKSSRASGCRTGGRTARRRWPRAPRRCSPPETATGRAPRASPRRPPPPSPGVPIRSTRSAAPAPWVAISEGPRGPSTRRASSHLCFSPPGWREPKFCSTSAASAERAYRWPARSPMRLAIRAPSF